MNETSERPNTCGCRFSCVCLCVEARRKSPRAFLRMKEGKKRSNTRGIEKEKPRCIDVYTWGLFRPHWQQRYPQQHTSLNLATETSRWKVLIIFNFKHVAFDLSDSLADVSRCRQEKLSITYSKLSECRCSRWCIQLLCTEPSTEHRSKVCRGSGETLSNTLNLCSQSSAYPGI